jgi:hypothetical protein
VAESPREPQAIVERRRLRRHWFLAAIPVAALLVVVSAKLLDEADPCPAPSAAPESELALMPAGLSFEGIGTVTEVRKDDRYFRVKAFTTKPIDEVGVLIQDAVLAAGYRPAGIDDEGTEAQVFFLSGSFAAGQATVRWAGCEGRSDIELVLLDRAAVPSG